MQPEDIDVRAPEWRDLDSLLGAHLHQDVDVVHGSAWEAVVDFANEGSAKERRSAARALRLLLDELEDDGLVDAVGRLGMQHDPTYDGYSSYRVWLTGVADYLDDPEAHPGPPERDAPRPG